MRQSIPSSSTSAPCRLEWRPSRWLIAALGALAVVAALCVLASDAPGYMAWPLALLTILYGGWLARNAAQRPWHELVWRDEGPPILDGLELQHAQVHWRGPLAFLQWRDSEGAIRRLAWWPDTLSRHSRRELRLAAGRGAASRRAASMAP